MSIYCRTCQECGNIQQAKDPKHYVGDSWQNLKCRKCKSEALDYGSDSFYLLDGKIVKMSIEDRDFDFQGFNEK